MFFFCSIIIPQLSCLFFRKVIHNSDAGTGGTSGATGPSPIFSIPVNPIPHLLLPTPPRIFSLPASLHNVDLSAGKKFLNQDKQVAVQILTRP